MLVNDFFLGIRSVLDPTGQVLPARPRPPLAARRVPDLGDRVGALVAALRAEEDRRLTAVRARAVRPRRSRAGLGFAGLTALGLTLGATPVFGAVAFSSDAVWPVVAVGAGSACWGAVALALLLAAARRRSAVRAARVRRARLTFHRAAELQLMARALRRQPSDVGSETH
ncbi:hypothetical protein AB0K09_10445 [Streptomyces sp. NPDC049577]|uniref:hypothetical protein n=1 Tax=Streptomyces sp. NPDC049577 TaxID=3155153 RepID=UPI0034437A97